MIKPEGGLQMRVVGLDVSQTVWEEDRELEIRTGGMDEERRSEEADQNWR